MSLLKPLDEKFPIERQLGIAAAPVVLISLFTLVLPTSRDSSTLGPTTPSS